MPDRTRACLQADGHDRRSGTNEEPDAVPDHMRIACVTSVFDVTDRQDGPGPRGPARRGGSIPRSPPGDAAGGARAAITRRAACHRPVSGRVRTHPLRGGRVRPTGRTGRPVARAAVLDRAHRGRNPLPSIRPLPRDRASLSPAPMPRDDHAPRGDAPDAGHTTGRTDS